MKTIERLLQAVNLDLPPNKPPIVPPIRTALPRNADDEAVILGFACAGVTPTFLRGATLL